MAYNFAASQLSSLYGHQFSSQNHKFEIQPKTVFRARTGLEAYGVQVRHTSPDGSSRVSFLKIFKHDIPERKSRTGFLVKLGLAKNHWIFQGVPYGLFPGNQINGVQVVGHLTKFLGMEHGGPAQDFAELKEKWDTFGTDERRAFACHLASAVEALERSGIVHGDLSPNNIMIGPGPAGRAVCCLCDFDGFNQASVPKLPRKFERQDVRPLGSVGYQSEMLMSRIDADPTNSDEGLTVETDRFALSGLVFELMVWGNDTSEQLGRGELLTEEIIRKRSLDGVPKPLLDKFPAGVPVLKKALAATSGGELPSPRDWLVALGLPSVLPRQFRPPPSFPKLELTRRDASTSRTVHLNTSKAGNLAVLHRDLADVAFTRNNENRVHLTFTGALPVLIERGGRSQKLADPERKGFEVFPADAVKIADWEMRFDDSIPAPATP